MALRCGYHWCLQNVMKAPEQMTAEQALMAKPPWLIACLHMHKPFLRKRSSDMRNSASCVVGTNDGKKGKIDLHCLPKRKIRSRITL